MGIYRKHFLTKKSTWNIWYYKINTIIAHIHLEHIQLLHTYLEHKYCTHTFRTL
jgi:hypothetical protein